MNMGGPAADDARVRSHLREDELIARLYGLDAGAAAHLEGCEDCAARWEAMQDRRTEVVAGANVSAAVLTGQRRRILARIEAPPLWMRPWVWVPALGAAFLIAAGLAVYQPRETVPPAPAPVAGDAAGLSGEDWLEDAYSAQPVEPRAAGPLRELFEEEAATE